MARPHSKGQSSKRWETVTGLTATLGMLLGVLLVHNPASARTPRSATDAAAAQTTRVIVLDNRTDDGALLLESQAIARGLTSLTARLDVLGDTAANRGDGQMLACLRDLSQRSRRLERARGDAHRLLLSAITEENSERRMYGLRQMEIIHAQAREIDRKEEECMGVDDGVYASSELETPIWDRPHLQTATRSAAPRGRPATWPRR